MKKHFEFKDGKSNVFWEIEVRGRTITITFGAIGSKGQSETKEFGSKGKCLKEAEKLIAEKVKKGYREGRGNGLAPIQDGIKTIRLQLARLRALAPKKQVLYRVGARWSEAELRAFERKHGVKLPLNYRMYLREIGDGGAGFSYHGDSCGGLRELRRYKPKELEQIAKTFPFTKKWANRKEVDNYLENDEPFSWGVRGDGCLYIGTADDHREYVLVITGPAAGTIWIDGIGLEGGGFFPTGKTFLELNQEWFAARICTFDLDERITTELKTMSPDKILKRDKSEEVKETLEKIAFKIIRTQEKAIMPDQAACKQAAEIFRALGAWRQVYEGLAYAIGADWSNLFLVSREAYMMEKRERDPHTMYLDTFTTHIALAAIMLNTISKTPLRYSKDPNYYVPDRETIGGVLSRLPEQKRQTFLNVIEPSIALSILSSVKQKDCWPSFWEAVAVCAQAVAKELGAGKSNTQRAVEACEELLDQLRKAKVSRPKLRAALSEIIANALE